MSIFAGSSVLRSAKEFIQPNGKIINTGGGPLNSMAAPMIVSDEQLEQYVRSIEQSVEFFNFAWEKAGLEGRLDAKRLVAQLKNPSNNFRKSFEPVVSNKYKGVWSAEHVLTAVSILYMFLDPDYVKYDISLRGACQSAKTMVFAIVFLLAPIVSRAFHNKLLIPVVNTPVNTNNRLGALTELQNMMAIYADIDFVHQRGRYPMTYVRDSVLREFVNSGSTVRDLNALVLMRYESNLKELTAVIQQCRKKESSTEIVCINDENHIGSGRAQCLRRYKDSLPPEIKEVFREIAVTATNSESSASDKMVPICQWISPVYSGIIMYNGKSLPTINNVPIRPPEFKALGDVFPAFESCLDTELYTDRAHFLDSRPELGNDDEKVASAHAKYRQKFARGVADIYVKLATEEDYPIIFLRPFKECKDCETLLEDLEKDLAKRGLASTHHVLKYFGDLEKEKFGDGLKTPSRTIKEYLIDEYVSKRGAFCIVIAAQRGSYSESFPAECKYYIDMFEDRGTWNTGMQTTWGRAQGHGKKSVCLFQRGYVKTIDEFIENGCFSATKRFGSREKPPGGRGRPSANVAFYF